MDIEENKKTRILIVDDDEPNLRVFRYTFMRKYDVLTTPSTQEAMEMCRDNDIDVIISDQRMPGMTGTELLMEIKDDNPNMVKMITSAYFDKKDFIIMINDIRLDKFVEKPWNMEQIEQYIEEELERKGK